MTAAGVVIVVLKPAGRVLEPRADILWPAP
jgi:hypothetical protein